MKSLQKGQAIVLIALAFIFLILTFAALAIDLPSLWVARRDRQKLSDAACLAGAIADENGQDIQAAILQSFSDNGVAASLYTPKSGTGVTLSRGYEWGSDIRVALWGETLTWWSHFIPGVTTWEMGARAHCKAGLGGVLPLAVKEYEEPGTRILSTDDPNDEWSGPCPDQTIPPWDPVSGTGVDPLYRTPENCWVWGDWQILAGDGHVPNEGDVSMNGLIAPDIRCEGLGLECVSKVFIPPADPAQVNKYKDLTMGYIAAGGYNGPVPIVGNYYGEHSALIAQMEGVSNKFLAQTIDARYDVGDLVVVFVYDNGKLWDGNKNFDYVEVIGYAVVEIVYIDANTVAVVPFYPGPGSISTIGQLENALPKTYADLAEAGFELHSILIPWD